MQLAVHDPARPLYWNVLFLPRATRERWWDWLTWPEMRHVVCYAYCVRSDTFVLIDANDRHNHIVALTAKDIDQLSAYAERLGVLLLRVQSSDRSSVVFRLVQTCVSVVGRTVGGRGAFTPQGLARNLIADGAEVLLDTNECLPSLQNRTLLLWRLSAALKTVLKRIA